MKKILVITIFALILVAFMVLPAAASDMPCPTPGPEFGKHVSSMAPEYPIMHGRMFGKMISSMARGMPCPPMH